MSPNKVGRPKEQNPHDKRFEVRLTQEQYQLLEDCSKRAKIKKSEVIVKGIELFNRSL